MLPSLSYPRASLMSWRRRWLVVFLVAVLGTILTSYIQALLRPGNSNFKCRSGLWLREHGLSPVVDWGERCWYMWKRRNAIAGTRPPSVQLSPETLRSLQPLSSAVAPPRALLCHFQSCAQDEGVWHAVGAQVAGAPALYVTYFRPDSVHGGVWSGAVLFDQTRVRTQLIAGTREPRGFRGAWRGTVAPQRRARLLAAFNGGFRFADAAGGFFANNHVGAELRDEAASLVVYRDGHADIGAWERDLHMQSNVVAVRQNLKLLVEHGTPVAGLSRNANGEWGAGKNQGLYTWRSGLGIRPDSSLDYVAGDGLTLSTLATALVQAGSSRAMELDIHDSWVTCLLYSHDPVHSNQVHGEKLLRTMAFDEQRFLLPDDRDFVAVFAR